MKNFLKSLIPEKNIAVGYLVAALIFGVVHGLAALGVTLDADQSTKIAAASAVIAAHIYDSIDKFLNPKPKGN
jgi:hypothetical protein